MTGHSFALLPWAALGPVSRCVAAVEPGGAPEMGWSASVSTLPPMVGAGKVPDQGAARVRVPAAQVGVMSRRAR